MSPPPTIYKEIQIDPYLSQMDKFMLPHKTRTFLYYLQCAYLFFCYFVDIDSDRYIPIFIASCYMCTNIGRRRVAYRMLWKTNWAIILLKTLVCKDFFFYDFGYSRLFECKKKFVVLSVTMKQTYLVEISYLLIFGYCRKK